MRAVIHQPYFLPWLGYFSKLFYADKFIVLDNVNFTKGAFIDRVQIVNNDGKIVWLGVPVGQQFKKHCNQIYFSDPNFGNRIVTTLYSTYSKGRYFKENITEIETMLIQSFQHNTKLTDINMEIILFLLRLLDIPIPDIIYSSNFEAIADPTLRVAKLLKNAGCDTLITGNGGSLVKHNLTELLKNNINIYLQDYYSMHPTYYQTRRTRLGFAKGLSIVDCIFNEGLVETRKMLTDKRYVPHLYLAPATITK